MLHNFFSPYSGAKGCSPDRASHHYSSREEIRPANHLYDFVAA